MNNPSINGKPVPIILAFVLLLLVAPIARAAAPIVRRELLGPAKVPCLVCFNKGVKGAPVAIVQHWWSGKKEDMRGFGVELARRGFIAVLPDARMHGERGGGAPAWNGDIFPIMRDTVKDISGILDSLSKDKRADTKRVGMTGISMGGMITHLAVTLDKRITVAAVEAGTPDWTFIANGYLPAETLAYIRDNQPLTHPERYRNTALLMLHGLEDYMVPGSGNRMLYDVLKPRHAKTPDRLVLREYEGVDHPTTTDMNNEAMDWLTRHLLKRK